jgi:hypothetical protein
MGVSNNFLIIRGGCMKKLICYLGIIFMVLVSGCVTMTVESKVNSNGDIADYKMIIETTATVYNLLNNQADGGSLEYMVESQGGTYKEEWDKDEVTITVTDIIPDDEKLSTEISDDYIVYRDSRFDDLEGGVITIHYYLEMPSDIVDSNADSVNGNKAEWHIVNSNSMREIYAQSEVPVIPGLSVFSVLCILLVLAFIKRW